MAILSLINYHIYPYKHFIKHHSIWKKKNSAKKKHFNSPHIIYICNKAKITTWLDSVILLLTSSWTAKDTENLTMFGKAQRVTGNVRRQFLAFLSQINNSQRCLVSSCKGFSFFFFFTFLSTSRNLWKSSHGYTLLLQFYTNLRGERHAFWHQLWQNAFI